MTEGGDQPDAGGGSQMTAKEILKRDEAPRQRGL